MTLVTITIGLLAGGLGYLLGKMRVYREFDQIFAAVFGESEIDPTEIEEWVAQQRENAPWQ